MADTYSNGKWTVDALPDGANQGVLQAVTCTSTTSCVAVGSFSNAPVAEVLAGTSWSSTAVPIPPGGDGLGDLTGVSCDNATSALFCAVAGNFETPGQADEPMAVTFSGGGWTPVPLPLPPGSANVAINTNWALSCVAASSEAVGAVADELVADSLSNGVWSSSALPLPPGTGIASLSGGQPPKSGVSCVSASSCIAVADVGDATYSYNGLVETDSSGTWTPAILAQPTGGSATLLSGVSCVSNQHCVTTGGDETGNGGVFDTLSSGAWTVATLPGAPGQIDDASTAVSCSSSSVCVSVGGFFAQDGSQLPYAETLSAGNWSLSVLPLPHGVPPSSGGGIFEGPSPLLLGVSCVSGSWCAAVGQDQGRDGTHPLIEILSGGKWTASSFSKSFAMLSSISCTAVASCTAVGTTSRGDGLVATLIGSTWTERLLASPFGKERSLSLAGVSCPTTTSCVAVGGEVGPATDSQSEPLVATFSRGAFALQVLPLPSDQQSNNFGFPDPLTAVSCPSVRSCAAVGSYVATGGSTYGQILPLNEIMVDGRWTEAQAPSQSGEALSGVSCMKMNSCVAVGSGGGLPLIETLAGGYWNETPLSMPAGDSQVELQSVSCQPADSSCVGVGEEGNAGGYNPIVAVGAPA